MPHVWCLKVFARVGFHREHSISFVIDLCISPKPWKFLFARHCCLYSHMVVWFFAQD